MNTSNLTEKDFEISKQLGSGSFGTVHMAKKRQDGKTYAIKSVQLSQMSQKEKDAALNEVRLLASINIPYVIGYHGAFFDANKQTLCIVMQFADGGDLQGKVTQLKDTTEQGFQQKYVWKVAYQILNGLKILHKNKIIHRDIKSANIFFSNGIAKLGDLNVSKVAEQGMCSTQTGTPYYTSPQIWKGQQYTSKCDIWSTGCLLYEMCQLTHPFKGRDFPSLYRKVIVGNYEQVSSKYSHQLQELIRMCLTVDDEMRPSAAELLETTVLSGMDANMDKFDNKGEVNLIDAIKCPRVLKFLNTKLPKPLTKDDINKKTVNFATKKEIQRTEGQGFKIHKAASLRRIRSEKILPAPCDSSEKNQLSRVTSKKQIKLPPLEGEENPSILVQDTPSSPIRKDNSSMIKDNSSIIKQNSSLVKSPLSFSQKKLKPNSSIKRIVSRKNITIDESRNIERSSIEKNDSCVMKANNGSRVLMTQSGKKIQSTKHIQFADKENKKLIL